MNGEFCLIGQDSVKGWYQHNIDEGVLKPDPGQERVMARLQELSNKIASSMDKDGEGLLSRLIKGRQKPTSPKGVYVHGTVGRGKSFLMDGFYLNLPIARKLRVHFHGFMQHYHADMKKTGKRWRRRLDRGCQQSFRKI